MHTVYITPFNRSFPGTAWNTGDPVVVNPYQGIYDQQRAGQRVADARKLELQRVSQPEDGWRRGVVDAVVATWLPVFTEGQRAYRAAERRNIEVQRITQPNDQWFYRVNVFDPALWPAVDRVLRGYRMADRARLAVENVIEPQFSWVFQANDAFVAKLASVWAVPSKYRKPANPAIDPNVPQPSFAWVNGVTDATIAVYLQSLYPRGYQQPGRQTLPSTAPLQSWIYNAVTPAYNTSFWPAIQSIQSYRAVDRQSAPSTAPPTSWIYNAVTPAYNTAFFAAIQALQANAGRALLPGLIIPTIPLVPFTPVIPVPPVGTDVYLYWMHRKINKRM